MFTTSESLPPVRTTSGESDAVKLRCGVLPVAMTSAATSGGTPPPASTRSTVRVRHTPDVTRQVRLKADTTSRRKCLLDLLLQTCLVTGAEAILLRQDLTAPVQQIVRGRHPHLVVVRRRPGAEQHRHRVAVLLAPRGNHLLLVAPDVDPAHRQPLLALLVVQLLHVRERGA